MTNNVVTIDDVDCKVEWSGFRFIQCITGEASSASDTVTNKVGNHGLWLKFYNGTQSFDTDSLTPTNEWLSPTGEPLGFADPGEQFSDYGYSQTLTGWFKAPVTGQYTFYTTGNHRTRLSVSPTHLTTSDLTQIIDTTTDTPYMNYFSHSS